VGDVQRALGSLEEARQRYEEGLRVSERLVKVTGESPEALFDLACSVERIGDLHRQAGDAPAARACFEREVRLAESALRQSPLSVDFQNLLANARGRLAAMPSDTP
jgi:tetratricopeptide (TPR) repeat protein